MLKALDIKLYPNLNQEIYLAKLFGCYRKVYNLCLAKNEELYSSGITGFTNLVSFTKHFHNNLLKDDELEYLTEHNTKILKDSLSNLGTAFKNFFKHGRGYPKFKSKSNDQSIGLYKEAFSKKVFHIENKMFISSKFGLIKYRTSKEYKDYLEKYKDCIVRITIKKTKCNEYFARVIVDSDIKNDRKRPNSVNSIVGLDLGIKSFIVDSNGNEYENLKSYRNNAKQLVRLNRSLSRKVKGSNNRKKARIKYAKKWNRITNVKDNYLDLISSKLIDENQIIVIEDLNIKGMMKNKNLAKSIQELSLSRFREMLKYKCEWYDRLLIVVDRFFPSSKICNGCGYKNKNLKLSDREWVCPECGQIHNRDENAAINLKNYGIWMILNNPEYERFKIYLEKLTYDVSYLDVYLQKKNRVPNTRI